ncbi:hypothetical protein B0H11DRAFT_2055784 [Mycena galericulata]|nr:hypothetical protein B0H11DRAFT_2055784 [Mycena galericulata]
MQFEDLSEDDLRSILSFCDVYAVLAVGRTNKYLRRLTLEKLVWVDLVENLRRKGFIDHLSLPDIQSRSQEALVALVKRLLTGPVSWTAPIIPKPSFMARFRSKTDRPPQQQAKISKQFLLHPSCITDYHGRPLPGGEYVLFCNRTLQCWSVLHDQLVWSYETPLPSFEVMDFAAEVLHGGDTANILIWETQTPMDHDPKALIHIVNLNLRTGTSTILRTNCLPGICGNMAYIGWKEGSYYEDHCILMDWQKMLHLKLAGEPGMFVNLIPDHVLVMMAKPSGTSEIRVLNAATFSRHWRHTTDASELDIVPVIELETVILEKIPFTRAHPRTMVHVELCTYESPVEEGTYRVWAHLVSRRYSSTGRTNIALAYSYTLSLPNRMRDGIIWHQRTAHTADHVYGVRGISYSGHKLAYSVQNQQLTCRLSHPGNPSQDVELTLPIPAPYPFPFISTYSGALTFLANSLVIVTYCK